MVSLEEMIAKADAMGVVYQHEQKVEFRISGGVSLEIEDFEKFYEARKTILTKGYVSY